MSATIKDTNHIPHVINELDQLKRLRTRIGLFQVLAGPDVVNYAAINEYGGGHVPERSFMRSAALEAQELAADLGADGVRAVLAQKASARDVYAKVGLFMQERVVSKINEQIPPPLAPSTVKRKGTTKTLIDKGTMRKSITYVVEQR